MESLHWVTCLLIAQPETSWTRMYLLERITLQQDQSVQDTWWASRQRVHQREQYHLRAFHPSSTCVVFYLLEPLVCVGRQMTAVRTQRLWFLCSEKSGLLQSVCFLSTLKSSLLFQTKRETSRTYKWIAIVPEVSVHIPRPLPSEAVPAPDEAHHLLCWNSLLKGYL